MKKFVIAITLAMVFLTLLSTTVFAQPPVPNPNPDENACWGQTGSMAARDPETWYGTDNPGQFVSYLATSELEPGVAGDIQNHRCIYDCGQCTPRCP